MSSCCSSQSRLDPSMSVSRNVTTPVGNDPMMRVVAGPGAGAADGAARAGSCASTPRFELDERGAGLDPELSCEYRARLACGRERLGLLAAAIARDDQQLPERLVQRMAGRRAVRARAWRAMVAVVEQRVRCGGVARARTSASIAERGRRPRRGRRTRRGEARATTRGRRRARPGGRAGSVRRSRPRPQPRIAWRPTRRRRSRAGIRPMRWTRPPRRRVRCRRACAAATRRSGSSPGRRRRPLRGRAPSTMRSRGWGCPAWTSR